MEQLKTEIAQSHPEIAASIDREYSYIKDRTERRNGIYETAIETEVEITYWPNKDAFNPDLMAHLSAQANEYRRATEEFRVAIDLNQDGSPEMLTITDNYGYFQGRLWYETEDGWEQRIVQVDVPKNKDLKYSLQNTEIRLLEPKYKIMNLDGISIDINQ